MNSSSAGSLAPVVAGPHQIAGSVLLNRVGEIVARAFVNHPLTICPIAWGRTSRVANGEMALIREFEPERPQRTGTHAPARCTYFTFEGPDGQPYLQFNTYGSSGRKHPEVPSQTIQLDRAGMTQLARILLRALEQERAA